MRLPIYIFAVFTVCLVHGTGSVEEYSKLLKKKGKFIPSLEYVAVGYIGGSIEIDSLSVDGVVNKAHPLSAPISDIECSYDEFT